MQVCANVHICVCMSMHVSVHMCTRHVRVCVHVYKCVCVWRCDHKKRKERDIENSLKIFAAEKNVKKLLA